MRSEAPGDVLKVWFYATASVLLGAWWTPLLYNAGKALAEVSSVKQTNGPLEWLANHCRAASFPEFFEAGLLLAAVFLFLPFIRWLHHGQSPEYRKSLAWRHLDHHALPEGQPLHRNPWAARQMVMGFLIVSVLFFLIAGILMLLGVLQWKNPGESLGKVAFRGFWFAVVLAVVQEFVFRGIALGIFLRAMRPSVALAVAALLFALVHFLNPPPGLNVLDPDGEGTGFELLGKIVDQFGDLRAVLGSLAPMLALGGILGYSRWRTASLALPIGLHAGWLFVNAILASVTIASGNDHFTAWLLSGTALRRGLIPLAGIVLAGVLTVYLTKSDVRTDSAV